MQQPKAPLEGVSAHFSNAYVPILLSLGRETKVAEFCRSYFRDFVGAPKIEDLSESKNFFAEVLQITSRFVLAKQI